jgi:hypothetical protein
MQLKPCQEWVSTAQIVYCQGRGRAAQTNVVKKQVGAQTASRNLQEGQELLCLAGGGLQREEGRGSMQLKA